MKLTTLLLLPLASTALASVTFYTDKDYVGESKFDIGCVNLDGNFANRISSIKPTTGFTCVFYTSVIWHFGDRVSREDKGDMLMRRMLQGAQLRPDERVFKEGFQRGYTRFGGL